MAFLNSLMETSSLSRPESGGLVMLHLGGFSAWSLTYSTLGDRSKDNHPPECFRFAPTGSENRGLPHCCVGKRAPTTFPPPTLPWVSDWAFPVIFCLVSKINLQRKLNNGTCTILLLFFPPDPSRCLWLENGMQTGCPTYNPEDKCWTCSPTSVMLVP